MAKPVKPVKQDDTEETPKTTALAKWDEELAKQAEVAAGMEAGAGGGKFFSLKAGVLSFDGNPLKNNEMAVIVIDSILENVYYDQEYDPDSPSSPKCYAFARDEAELKPHKLVVVAGGAQHEQCQGCKHNEWGSAEKGKGKACRNVRRLALISAGTFNKDGTFTLEEDEDHFKTAPIAYMKLPVTSVKGYATFVKQLAGTIRRPPHGVITKVKVMPDPKSQFKVIFEALENVPDELMGVVMERNKAEKSVIDFPYPSGDDAEKGEDKKQDRSPPKKAAAKKGKY